MAGWPVPISPSQAHFNREEATTARQSNELAASRAYQVRAADLAAAGLNPILAVSQGGAQVPSAAAASVGAGGTFDPSTAANLRLVRAQISNVEQDTVKKREEAGLTRSMDNSAALRFNLETRLFGSREEREIAENYSAAALHRNLREVESSAYGRGLRYGERSLPFINTAVSVAKPFVGGSSYENTYNFGLRP